MSCSFYQLLSYYGSAKTPPSVQHSVMLELSLQTTFWLCQLSLGFANGEALEGDMETGGGRMDLLFPICFLSLLCFFLLVLFPINVTLVSLAIPVSTGQCQMIFSPTVSVLPSVCFNNYSVFPLFPSANSHSCHFCGTLCRGWQIVSQRATQSTFEACKPHELCWNYSILSL